ncbi:TonB-dependent siderophore receptor [Fulvimarina sp. 2208YS6-2-32]|uniref:TonB-dependent siderophore receptor n=1 Tax=Fulvimarina uroteuthidis TaxID=3098149 RepID=A0ABU5I189_9HYPH|nr:TonB-dependent siderophore receptor [Fulvimarina sp. 2208YS6-2-32]MDY8108897.1 TonB-dependent siderophore receptor [Fulvimarina sp. 2208YS6-2-32]
MLVSAPSQPTLGLSLKRFNILLLVGSAALGGFGGTAIAQDTGPAGGTIALDAVVVEADGGRVVAPDGTASLFGGAYDGIVAARTTVGSRMPTTVLETPASVSVVTSEEIAIRNADSVEEALDYTAGVNTGFYGSDDRFDFIRIRGFDAYTFRDGLLLGAPFGAPREEIYAFDRVEVLKGANSSVFGLSAPGGLVNYVTKLPRREAFGEAYVTGGSFEHKEIGLDVGGNLTADDTLSYRMTAKLQDADKEYDASNDDEKFGMAGLTWRPTDSTNLSIVYDHLYIDSVPGSGGQPIGFDFPRSRYFGEPDYNYRGTERDTVSLSFDHDFGNGFSVATNARYSSSSSDFGYAYIASSPPPGSSIAQRAYFGNETESDVFVVDTHGLYEFEVGNVRSRTLFGGEYRNAKADDATAFASAPPIDVLNPIYTGRPSSVPIFSDRASDQRTRALYAQEELTFFDRLTATVGVRNDWLDLEETNKLTGVTRADELSETTGRLGLSYLLTDEFSVFGSYAESVIPAAVGVEPETGHQYEVGVKYQPEAFPALLTASVYDLTRDNLTRTDPVTLQQVPIGEVGVRGLDLEAKMQLPFDLDLVASYSYLDAEIGENGTLGNEGNRPAFVAEHVASAFLTYTVPGSGWRGDLTIGGGARYEGPYFFDDANTQNVGGHTEFDALLVYEVAENATLQANAKNLFDKKYVSYGGFGANFYNAGREIDVTLRYTW